MGNFELHPALARDGVALGDWGVCRVLLLNDSRYPWLVLVPRREGLRDLDQLHPEDAPRVWGEMVRASAALRTLFQPDKLNVGALGNLVPQLHIHVIARFRGDDAWPQPVWGRHPPIPYEATALAERVAALRGALGFA